MRKIVLLVLSLLGLQCVSPVWALDLHGLPADGLALWVAPVEGDAVTLAYRAGEPVSPASTMKLLTSWAALERLGPDFRWKTELVSDAPVVDGVLQGDLYWVGQGDPHFFSSQLNELVNGLHMRGIQGIAGRLVLDDSAYNRISSAEGFDADEGESFMAPPEPYLTNLNVVWLTFFHDDIGARVAMNPPLSGIHLESDLKTGGDGACHDVRQHVQVEQLGGRLVVHGKLPAACDGKSMYLQPLPADQFASAAFAGVWQQLGGSGPGGMVKGRAPANARVLARVESDTLARILPDINKNSSNPMARSVFLTLGRLAPVSGQTVADADRAVRETLAQHHLSDATLVLENGSGLSRRERISARLLGEVLRSAARGAYASELAASLPVAGQSGTLKKRFIDLGPGLRLKTGTLAQVASLAGYWQGPDGRRWVIVALAEGKRAAVLRPSLDALVHDIVGQLLAGRI